MALLKNNIRLPAILVLLMILFSLSLAGAREEELLLGNPDEYPENHRAAVIFPHELHVGNLECLACHHDCKDGKNILDEKKLEEGNPDILCASCHDENSGIDLEEAYHRQCMGCHRQFRLAGFATGPELCGECHIKGDNFRKVKSGEP